MKKLIFVISFIVLSGFLFWFTAPEAKAATAVELQAQIQQLQAQIVALQQQLSQLQPQQPVTWCYTFNVNLGVGNIGSEVTALQTAISKEGLYTKGITGTFDEYTASAVVAFQEKYASEVLASWGLTHGTGYVGPTTRTKLNSLYSCGLGKPHIQVVSPNGGEQWMFGNAYNIVWKANKVDKVDIQLEKWAGDDGQIYAGGPFTQIIDEGVSASVGSYSWPLGHLKGGIIASAGNYYKIRIVKTGDTSSYSKQIADSSDNYFSIVAATATQPSINISVSSGNQTNDSALIVNIGNTFTISGVPQNLQGLSYWFGSGYPPPGYYNRAFFFDQNFGNNNSCGNNEASVGGPWTMTCTAKVAGSSNFYIEIYANGQIYKSNVVSVTILPSIQSSITIISPNGGEQWQTGKTYTISWKAINNPTEASWVGRVALYKGVSFLIDIVPFLNKQPTTGSAQWAVPLNSVTGNDFRVQVILYTGVPGSESQISSDFSDNYFSIVSATTTTCTDSDGGKDYYTKGIITEQRSGQIYTYTDFCYPGGSVLAEYFCPPTREDFGVLEDFICPYGCQDGVCKSTASITFISPSGGETWTIGKTHNITWTGGGNISSFPVYLRGGTLGSSGKYIGGAYASQKVFSWTISSDIAAGSGYYIQFGIAPTMVLGVSKTFTIVSGTPTSSITVISPNGGEKWMVGNTYTIKWSIVGYDSSAKIQIGLRDTRYDPNLGTGEATIINTMNTGSYTWTIPSEIGMMKLGAGDVYKVVIYLEGGGAEKYDLSDNNFSIVPARVVCTDSDGGKNYYVKGWVQDSYDTKPFYDYCTLNGAEVSLCADPSQNCGIIEKYCDVNNRRSGHYISGSEFDLICPNGCQDGACLSSSITPSITVISPNGGERLVIGNTYDITWKASGVNELQLAVMKGDVAFELIPSVPASAGKYSWTVGAALFSYIITPGDQYRIRILTLPTPSGTWREGIDYDKSDNYFSIVAEENPLGLEYMENQLASLIDAVSGLIEQLRGLLER